MTSNRRVVFDEFTSVVDRTVARIGAAAVAQAVRRTWCGRPACESKQFVAVTCHYDVAQWLQADWVLDMGSGHLTRGRLRRPKLRLCLHRTTADAWPMFARHHYLTAALNRSAHCYVGLLEGVERAECRMSKIKCRKKVK